MKSFHHYAQGLLAIGALVAAAGLAFSSSAQSLSGSATIVEVQGKARYSMDKKTWQSARKGTVLNAGSIIQTADNSGVELLFNNGLTPDNARISANTVLAFDRLGANDMELDLTAGEITSHVQKPNADARYEIKFSTGVAGSRENGTYRITASGIVDVISGSVVVAVIGGDLRAVTVNAGQRLNPGTFSPTAIPANSASIVPAVRSQPPAASATPAAPQTPAPANPAPKPGMGGSIRKF